MLLTGFYWFGMLNFHSLWFSSQCNRSPHSPPHSSAVVPLPAHAPASWSAPRHSAASLPPSANAPLLVFRIPPHMYTLTLPLWKWSYAPWKTSIGRYRTSIHEERSVGSDDPAENHIAADRKREGALGWAWASPTLASQMVDFSYIYIYTRGMQCIVGWAWGSCRVH